MKFWMKKRKTRKERKRKLKKPDDAVLGKICRSLNRFVTKKLKE